MASLKLSILSCSPFHVMPHKHMDPASAWGHSRDEPSMPFLRSFWPLTLTCWIASLVFRLLSAKKSKLLTQRSHSNSLDLWTVHFWVSYHSQDTAWIYQGYYNYTLDESPMFLFVFLFSPLYFLCSFQEWAQNLLETKWKSSGDLQGWLSKVLA